jgi:RNA polymerase sigma-70 factor (ECF subfamily)
MQGRLDFCAQPQKNRGAGIARRKTRLSSGFCMHSESGRLNIAALLAQTGAGELAAREDLLAAYRPYLRLLAERRMPRVVQKRLDASDIVQQTLVDAVRGLPEFRGHTEPEFTAWMVRLLERNFLMSIRDHTLGKRDIRLEQIWGDGSGSAVLTWQTLPADGSSPMSNVFRGEAALHLAAALEKLPADQRTALELRYISEETLQAIADEMGRSLSSVVVLIRRGVEALQEILPAEFGDFG